MNNSNEEIFHSGVAHNENPPGRGSGRYSWGSGDNPYQHQLTLKAQVERMRKSGKSDSEIATELFGVPNPKTGEIMKVPISRLKAELAIETTRERKQLMEKAWRLYDETGGNATEVGRRMGINESSVRSLLNKQIADRTYRYERTADFLRAKVEELGYVDVSEGTELIMGVTDNTKKVALEILKKEGYNVAATKIPNLTSKGDTKLLVLAKKDATWGDIQKNRFNVKPIADFTPDGGKTWESPKYPKSIDHNRVYIRYGDQGGKDRDGVIEIRRGVEDLSLGPSQYAQVRIGVDDTHYLKGMAIYSDDIPDGFDIVYNTNKHTGTPMMDSDPDAKQVLKTMKSDPNNRFGALIKRGGQSTYIDSDGKEQLSPINKIREEGDWESWSKDLSQQFLSKQPLKLINRQLKLSIEDKQTELDEIRSYTNDIVRKKFLMDFADNTDKIAAELSSRGFKDQKFQVILPVPKIKEDEIFAPNYNNGEKVALIRYPHAGTFEIPILNVNNNSRAALKQFNRNLKDAVGIHPNVAEQLSGADFDGDTVVVIPMTTNGITVTARKKLKGLENFDPKELYSLPPNEPVISHKTMQIEMGKTTNLITDMTVAGAPLEDICKAVKHSMVVIDSEKHHLDYKQSFKDNDIAKLKKDWQGKENAGASTVISRAKSPIQIPERREITDVRKMNPEQLKRWNEGKKVYEPTNRKIKREVKDVSIMTPEELALHNAGKKVYRVTDELAMEEVHRMDLVDDAMDLVRDKDQPKELAYASYANALKEMANSARKEARSIKPSPVSRSAREAYAKEVESLNNSLLYSELNRPRERTAKTIANNVMRQKLQNDPNMDKDHRMRESTKALVEARSMVGAHRREIEISDKEWEAIQAGAISSTKLAKILQRVDGDRIRELASPKESKTSLTSAQLQSLKTLFNSGNYSASELAQRFGVSTSYIYQIISKES